MEKAFDLLIDTFIAGKVGIDAHFLTEALALGLKANLHTIYAQKQFKYAGTGNETGGTNNPLIRGDRICWLEREHNNPAELDFFRLMDQFVSYLNRTCYTGITGYEFHYTLYEAGSFYKQHLDQFRNNDSRKYSMIIYLNAGWVEADGGQLRIHHAGHLQNIAPESGKGVFFKSNEMLHEVLPTTKNRLSITGWLKVN